MGISREEVNQMKNLLKIIGSNDDQPTFRQPEPLPLMENYEYDDYEGPAVDLSAFGVKQPQRQPQRQSRPQRIDQGYIISESYKSVPGLKKTDFYDVVNGEQTVFKYLALKESAKAILYLLDKGFTANHTRIQEVLDLDEKYFQGLKEYNLNKSRHKKLTEAGDTRAAKVFLNRMNDLKTDVLQAKDKLTILGNNF